MTDCVVNFSPLGGLGLGGTLFFGGRAGVSLFLLNGSSTNAGWNDKQRLLVGPAQCFIAARTGPAADRL